MRRLGGAKQDTHLEGSLLSVPPFLLEDKLLLLDALTATSTFPPGHQMRTRRPANYT